MEKHVLAEKLATELCELTEKLVKLREFITRREFRELSVAQQQTMIEQSYAMMQYADCLVARMNGAGL